jgi:hypothetical protein
MASAQYQSQLSLNDPAALKELDDQHNQRNDQQDVNQAA